MTKTEIFCFYDFCWSARHLCMETVMQQGDGITEPPTHPACPLTTSISATSPQLLNSSTDGYTTISQPIDTMPKTAAQPSNHEISFLGQKMLKAERRKVFQTQSATTCIQTISTWVLESQPLCPGGQQAAHEQVLQIKR